MSGIFKSIGKVFKKVVKTVGKVVKGAFKLVKKIAPYALAAAAIYFGGAALTGGFGAGGAGMTAAGTATASTAATGMSSAFMAANPSFAAVVGASNAGLASTGALSAGFSSGFGGSLWNTAKSVGGFLKDNKELVQIGSGILNGVQEQKTADADRKENARQFDESQKWQGAIRGVERDGTTGERAESWVYNPNQTTTNLDAENQRLDDQFFLSKEGTDLQDMYDKAIYRS